MLTDAEKIELVEKVTDEYGIERLFNELGLAEVSSTRDIVYSVCPFHEGADNPKGFAWQNGFGYCFTNCHRKFDLYNVVQKTKGYDFAEAIEFLAELVGFTYKYNTKRVCADSKVNTDFLAQVRSLKKKKNRKANWTPINPKVFEDFVPSLHRILRSEGFDDETRDYFGIHYATDGYMVGRIIVPIDYTDGTIVTVSGRIANTKSDKELEMEGIRRYQIWYDTDKSVTCYNISRALPYIKLLGEVIVVEGFKSVWRLHQWGYKNVVAVMGSDMSEEQKKQLLKLGVKITIVGDRDKAGKELNDQVVEEIRGAKLGDVRVLDMYKLNVPEKSSPSDITKEQFESLLSQSRYL